MSKVEALYQRHLDNLREMAIEKQIPFVDLLRAMYSPLEKNVLLALLLQGKESIEAENNLISRYRREFFEMIANEAINFNETAVEALANNKAIELAQAAVVAQNKQLETLAEGRKKANVARKAKGDELKALIEKMNADLLKLPANDNWTLEARANHIATKVNRSESYVRKLIATPRKID